MFSQRKHFGHLFSLECYNSGSDKWQHRQNDWCLKYKSNKIYKNLEKENVKLKSFRFIITTFIVVALLHTTYTNDTKTEKMKQLS